jgi:prolyl-tRNA synthetase
MRWSRYLLPTLKEVPAEAEIISHQLMLRSGMIRKLAAGIYNYLPLGYRSIRKLEEIIRQELNKAGCLEVHLPAVLPRELWEESGRWEVYGKELLRLRDRHDREFCFGPTHEEVVTDMVRREVRSYRQLPLNLYQIQVKFRDEIRPRFGLMRGREFHMKDGYSFDMDEEGLEHSYKLMHDAYSAVFTRCGLKYRAVEAESGPIGGSFSHEFMVLADSGESEILSCDKCDYAANAERAEGKRNAECEMRNAEFKGLGFSTPHSEIRIPQLEVVPTPNQKSIEDVTAFLKCRAEQMIKTLVLTADGKPLVTLIRGDHDLDLRKLAKYLGTDSVELASFEVIEKVTGAPVGFAGPVGLKGVRIVADHAIATIEDGVTGANQVDAHIVHVVLGRDYEVKEWADLRRPLKGDSCPRAACSGTLNSSRGIEVGHIFKLGTKYSAALGAKYLDEKGEEKLVIMGTYGIGVGRTLAASIEQNNDQDGIIWPRALAPFEVIVTPVNVNDPAMMQMAEKAYQELSAAGMEVIIDDRDERPGVKFKDADLIGIPLRVTVGAKAVKEGNLELRIRKTKEQLLVKPTELVDKVQEVLLRL